MKQKLFRDLGERFYNWRKGKKVRFIYGTRGKDLDGKIDRILGLIEDAERKKKRCFNR